jgi:hypothetical protein
MKVFNKQLEHFDDISFQKQFGRIRVFFFLGRPHTGGSQEKRKESFNLTIKYMMSIFPF